MKGDHDAVSSLPPAAIDAVHRIVTDPGRLTESWYEQLLDDPVADGHYVEIVGIVGLVQCIDIFHLGLGLPLEDLPEAIEGEASGYRPLGLGDLGGWMPMIAENKLSEAEADLYGTPRTGNVIKAMSLVPQEVTMMLRNSAVVYLPSSDVPDPYADGGRAISRAQIELIAARVSAVNECFY